MATDAETPPVVIIGAGIVGAATAYYLAKDHGVRSIVLEGYRPAGSASGKAGGFLARDWTRGRPKDALVQLSWKLYPELIKALASAGEDDVQYRPIDVLEVVADERRAPRDAKRAKAETMREYEWIDGHQFGSTAMGSASDGSTAQVHPGLLTLALLRQAKALVGSTVHHAHVDGLLFANQGPSVPKASSRRLRSGTRSASAEDRTVTHVIASGSFQEATLDPSEFLVAVPGGSTQASDAEELARAWSPSGVLSGDHVRPWHTGKEAMCATSPSTARSLALSASKVIVCTGPWTGRACSWFDPALTLPGPSVSVGAPCLKPVLPVDGVKVHSIVLLPAIPSASASASASVSRGACSAIEKAPAALFLDFVDAGATIAASPEVYPRADGSVYMCGCGDDDPLPDAPGAVRLTDGKPDILQRVARAISSSLDCAALVRAQACFLPMTEDDEPCVGCMPGVTNALVGAGHGCWGILMGPGTGQWLAREAVLGDAAAATGVALDGLEPSRFEPAVVPVAVPLSRAAEPDPEPAAAAAWRAALPAGGGGAHAGAVPSMPDAAAE